MGGLFETTTQNTGDTNDPGVSPIGITSCLLLGERACGWAVWGNPRNPLIRLIRDSDTAGGRSWVVGNAKSRHASASNAR